MSAGRDLEQYGSSMLTAEIVRLRGIIRRLLALIGNLLTSSIIAPDLRSAAATETAAAEREL